MQCHTLVSRIVATLSDSCTGGPLLARACFRPMWVLVRPRSVLRQARVVAVFNVNVNVIHHQGLDHATSTTCTYI